MANRAYNGFTISVQAVLAPIGRVRTALTKNSVDGDEVPVCMYSTVEFDTEKDAEAHGLQMAEKWIDENLRAKTWPQREVVSVKTTNAADSPYDLPLRARAFPLSPR